jgi:hypothetical protein
MQLVAPLMESLPAAIAAERFGRVILQERMSLNNMNFFNAGRFSRVILQAQMSLNKLNVSHAGRMWQSDAASTGVAKQGKAECCTSIWQVQPGRLAE